MGLCRSHDAPLLRDEVWDPAWNRRRMLQYFRDKKPISILGAIAFLSDNNVTNPRDRIYALLGMIRTSDATWVGDPDYAAAVEDVYHKFAVDHIEACKSLDMICYAQMFKRSLHYDLSDSQGMPSWVPDWRAKVRPRAVPLMVSQGGAAHIGNFRPLRKDGSASYAAAGSTQPTNLLFDRRKLSCDGALLDIIDGLGALTDENGKCSFSDQLVQSTSVNNTVKAPDLEGDLLHSTTVQQLLQTIATSLTLDRRDKYLLRKPPPRLLGEFITFCLAANHFPGNVQEQFLSWFQWNQSLLLHGYSLKIIFDTITLSPSSDSPVFMQTLRNLLLEIPVDGDYLVRMIGGPPSLRRARLGFDEEGFLPCFHNTALQLKRRLMVTEQGHIGMAPARSRKGDVVVVLYGCSVPVLLRPHQDQYEFIGECFVHGYMEGEILKEVEAMTKELSRFVLL